MPELPKCVSFTTHVLKSCDFRGGAAKVYFLYYTCTDKLRPSSRAAKVYLLVEKLRLSSRSCQSVFPIYCTCTDKLRPSSRSCQTKFPCTEKLRLSSRSCQSVFPVLHLYSKVATCEPELHCWISTRQRARIWHLAIHLYVGKLLSFTLGSRGTQKSHGQSTCRPLW